MLYTYVYEDDVRRLFAQKSVALQYSTTDNLDFLGFFC